MATREDALAFPPFTAPRRVRAELVASVLRSGRVVPDDAFDDVYPPGIRFVSAAYWTPLRVCARVVELLRLGIDTRVLDVGSGAGKFAIGTAALSGAKVRGVERQPELVVIAREAARRFGVQVDFVEGSFESEDPSGIDAAYFFNPFALEILLPGVADGTPMSAASAAADVTAAQRFLEAAEDGMQVVTYCGLGGAVPSSYQRLASETVDGGVLEHWQKRGSS